MTQEKKMTFEAQAIDLVTRYAKTAALALLAFVIAGAAYIAYGMFESSAETKSQEELFGLQKNVEEKEQKLVKDKEPPADDQADDAAKKSKKTAVDSKPKFEKTPQSLAANFTDDLKRYNEFIGAHQGKKASYMAAIQAARLAKDYKDYPQAEKILAGVVNVPHANDIFSGLLHAQYAAILMDDQKCPEAIKELNLIADNKAQSYFHAHTWLRLGACYIETKDWDKAQSALEHVEKDFANTQAASEARELKRLALLRSKGA